MAKYGKTKNNTAHEEWSKGKKIGRPTQVWIDTVIDEGMERVILEGHWDRLDANASLSAPSTT